MNRPTIGITMGDPAGIGPEIVAKALSDGAVYAKSRPLVIGDAASAEKSVRALRAFPQGACGAKRGGGELCPGQRGCAGI